MLKNPFSVSCDRITREDRQRVLNIKPAELRCHAKLLHPSRCFHIKNIKYYEIIQERIKTDLIRINYHSIFLF